MSNNIKRYNPSLKKGLTDEQIKERIENKLINYDTSVPTKSIKRILYENFFTLFNFLNLILGILVFSVGSYKNMLFLGIVIINTAISTIQEIHSKRVVDKLSLLSTSKAKVYRNGTKQEISIYDIVLDDIIEFELRKSNSNRQHYYGRRSSSKRIFYYRRTRQYNKKAWRYNFIRKLCY